MEKTEEKNVVIREFVQEIIKQINIVDIDNLPESKLKSKENIEFNER